MNGSCEIESVITPFNCAKACGAESRRKITNNSLEYCCFIHTSSHRETAKVINSF